jgi:penicillin-binding protein 2
MDPHTGEILAMVSRPTFDPNDFAVKISRDEWNKLINDPDKPLLNKAIQAQLAPGSTFKIIMATAGWQEGIAQTLHVNCTGGATFYGRRFGCWVKSGHGAVEITKAIYQSCDVFFYTLAEKLGIDRIAKYATAFGLGQKTGIDLPNEVSGVMPSEEWKIRNFKQKWFAGETISVGIGQGAVAITPVQLMRAIGAISMDGRMVVPHVINPTNLPPGYVETTHYTEVKSIPIDPDGMEHHHRCDEPGSVAGRHGSLGAHSGNRYRRQDRVGADRLAGAAREASEQFRFCPERLVCGIHAPAQSGHHRVCAVRRRRARETGGPSGNPGDQGLRR